jgi:hypothetical protein
MPNANNGAANMYMMKFEANMQTRDHNYRMPESTEKGKEVPTHCLLFKLRRQWEKL